MYDKRGLFDGLFKRSFALNSVQGLDVERHYTAYSFSEIKLQSKRSNGTTWAHLPNALALYVHVPLLTNPLTLLNKTTHLAIVSLLSIWSSESLSPISAFDFDSTR